MRAKPAHFVDVSAWARLRNKVIVAIVSTYDKLRMNKKICWWLGLAAKYLIVVLVAVVIFSVGMRVGQKQALIAYQGWFDDYLVEQEQLAEEDPYQVQLRAEAEEVAQALYGVKDNSTDDLKTYCWCIFNRVDNNSYPSTIHDVIAQPSQWMRYDATNPILENLYKIAYEQLDEWHTNTHRPVSNEFVFMNWSATSIVLRDNFYEGSGTHYWRWNQ